jgi:type II secretion system protein C
MKRIFLLTLALFSVQAVANPLDFKVLGVIAGTPGIALLKNPVSGQTFASRTGTALAEGLILENVERNYVTFKQKDKLIRVQVGDNLSRYSGEGSQVATTRSEPGLEVSSGTVRVERSYKEHILNNELSKVLMQAAAVPFYANGELKGFKLLEIDPNSVYEKFGFRNGDVVLQINGMPLSDAKATVRLLTSLKDAEEVDLIYQRDGIEQSMKVLVQ